MTDAQQKVLDSIKQLPDQCRRAWEDTQKLEFDKRYREIWNVAVCGMGASGLPAHVITSAFKTNVPVVSVNDYNLPSWAHEHTLVYLSSYSGSTDEILSCAQQAKTNGCMITGSTSGGSLGEFLRTNNYPAYIFTPAHNPSQQPRMGLGYGFFGQLGILARLGVIDIDKDKEGNISGALEEMRNSKSEIEETAKKLAEQIKDQVLIIFGAEHLVGSAHVFANQLNETAKTFATWFSIPEANHHLLEGLKHPEFPLAAIFLESDNYVASIKKRIELTKQIIEKSGYHVHSFSLERRRLSRLTEVLEVLSFSSYVSFYLSEAYGEDPIAIPWVDYFKKELEK